VNNICNVQGKRRLHEVPLTARINPGLKCDTLMSRVADLCILHRISTLSGTPSRRLVHIQIIENHRMPCAYFQGVVRISVSTYQLSLPHAYFLSRHARVMMADTNGFRQIPAFSNRLVNMEAKHVSLFATVPIRLDTNGFATKDTAAWARNSVCACQSYAVQSMTRNICCAFCAVQSMICKLCCAICAMQFVLCNHRCAICALQPLLQKLCCETYVVQCMIAM